MFSIEIILISETDNILTSESFKLRILFFLIMYSIFITLIKKNSYVESQNTNH
jgi:hypothetical protein